MHPNSPKFTSFDYRCPIEEHAKRTPSSPALIQDGITLSYRELDSHIQSHQLSEGIVSFSANSSLESIVTLFAHFRSGYAAYPRNYRLPQTPKLPFALDEIPALILDTSGSSGPPKQAALSLFNLVQSALGAIDTLNLESRDRYLLSLPLYHVGGIGIAMRTFCAGATLVLTSSPLERAIDQFKITHLSCVPTQLYRLLQHPTTLPSLKALLLGGAPIGTQLFDTGRSQGLPLMPTYGMTEMSSMITCSRSSLFSLGQTLPGRELKIGTNGQILVRGNTLFLGYITKEGYDSPTDSEGWLHTGDLGAQISGNLFVRGRKDNLFISGGENIHPEEIEQALCNLGSILEAIVVPKPDPEWGARPVAFVNFGDHPPLSLEDIREQLSEVLPRYKLPIDLKLLPRSTRLKPSRQGLAHLLGG